MSDMDLNSINQLFESRFMTAYYLASAKDKAKFIRFFPHFYRFWYYSALVGGTLLSPANIVSTVRSGERALTVPLANLEYSDYSYIDVTFTELSYSLDGHPAVEDFKTFVGLLTPDAPLTKNGFFPAALERKIYGAVSIKDTFYIEYLFLLSANLGLIKRMPSLYTNKVQATGRAGDFFARPQREIVRDIIEQTIELSAAFIKKIGSYNEFTINGGFIRNLLKKPIPTDELFKKVFESARDNFDFTLARGEPGDGNGSGPDDLERIITASTIMLGSLFDRFFFVPFGHYLKLIQPLYGYPYNFNDTLKALNVKASEGIEPALFVPCGSFSLTKLGMEYFGASFSPGENHMISPETPESLLVGLVFEKKLDPELVEEVGRYHEGYLKPVYELKVCYETEKSFWKRVVVAGEFKLHALHLFLCEEFSIDASPSYSVYASADRNDFARYAPPGMSRRKLTTETSIDDLGLSEGDKLLYTVNEALDPFFFWDFTVNDLSLSLEIVKIKKPTGIDYLPQVLKESRAFKELDYLNDTDFEP